MKKRLSFTLALSLLSIVVSAAAVEQPREFSASMSMKAVEGAYEARIYVSDKKTRLEMPQATMIVRMDRNVSYMLMPQEKMYMEQPVDTGTAARTGGEMPGEIERRSLGKETVNGVASEKFLIRYAAPGAGEQSVYQWLGEQGMPVKTSAVDDTWSVEFTDVKIGPQSEALFEPPSDYKRFEMPNMAEFMNSAGQ